MTMAGNKTATLLAGSCALGALLGGGPPELVDGLSRFGHHLGMAFQLIDDLLAIWGDPRRTGKPVGSDLRARKRSVPVVRALTAGGQRWPGLGL
ncbi:polyprenyl synthetase family protein [Micromonospora olivasterospora]|uniref:polyprenyl synthetase family protein n=1 Tax=Micromonospora olivasterospora TaxID=1880 RepID=UPI001B880948